MITEDGFEVDELALYFGSPYPINAYITVTLPTIGELVEYGERQYFSLINTLCAISSDMKSSLWDSGLDWTTVQDFDLFIMMTRNLPVEKTKIILGDVDCHSCARLKIKTRVALCCTTPTLGQF